MDLLQSILVASLCNQLKEESYPKAKGSLFCRRRGSFVIAYGQFKSCVSAPLLRNCGTKVHALLDHSLSYLVSRCSNTFYPLSYTCPTAPPPPPMTSVMTTTPLPPPPSTEPLPSAAIDSTTSLVSKPRTIIYTLPPTPGSRISSASTGMGGLLTVVLLLLSAIWIHLHS
ncbi:hypothetical protein AVEN_218743-1 [Araneus ventricosus]|uniref:Uncharacterized protein n=1 Tax=Araneus ventricosus TaxID=182803 RepID=A0A4Y2B4W9_ARAVE|nr:hypothetical protein AVEN_218743-1 [Araneus ventricosus]